MDLNLVRQKVKIGWQWKGGMDDIEELGNHTRRGNELERLEEVEFLNWGYGGISMHTEGFPETPKFIRSAIHCLKTKCILKVEVLY